MSDVDSDDAKPASKKRKATRACDRCNSQHQPCDNAIPKCSVCDRAGTSCTYDRPVRKRGPRSGYTGQNGERLWSIVLQARPDLEDLVLQVLRGGTFGNTGIPNLDYFKNNENQGDLVNRFNESRLGKFLQHGESPGLNLPPIDPNVLTAPLPGTYSAHGFQSAGQPQSPGHGRKRPHDSSSSNPGVASSHSYVAALGGPQDPNDIYVQSEDLRKRKAAYLNRTHDYENGRSLSRGVIDNYTSPSTNSPEENGFGGFRHMPLDGYKDDPREGFANNKSGSTPQSYAGSLGSQMNPQLDVTSSAHWFDPIPTDTLLNLGFVQGEGMADDFLELCQNPDPVTTPTDIFRPDDGEDEEEVWRRLVMRGRFV